MDPLEYLLPSQNRQNRSDKKRRLTDIPQKKANRKTKIRISDTSRGIFPFICILAYPEMLEIVFLALRPV
jgi:hypothetical protein